MYRFTKRAALLPVLSLLVLLAACDSNDPSGPGPDPVGPDSTAEDLFLLEATYFSNVYFPLGGRGPTRTLDPLPAAFTFEVPSSAFAESEVTTAPQEASLMPTLVGLGYNALSVQEVDLIDYATLTLTAPAGADMEFLNDVEVVFSADGLPDRVVGRESYLYGTEVSIYIDEYYAREYLLAPSFQAHLVLDPYQTPSVAGTYRFRLAFDVQFRVYDGDPAPAEVAFEREMYLRDALRQEGYDVGDVVSARVTEVALIDASGSPFSGLLDERLDAARIRIGSPETEETEEVAVLEEFEPDVSLYGEPAEAARAEMDFDVTAVVRRTGRLLVDGVLELDEAAAARGESYQAYLEVEVAFEVPVPEGPRSDDGERTMEVRVPMVVPVAAEK